MQAEMPQGPGGHVPPPLLVSSFLPHCFHMARDLTPAKKVSPKRIMLALDLNLAGFSPGAVGASG